MGTRFRPCGVASLISGCVAAGDKSETICVCLCVCVCVCVCVWPDMCYRIVLHLSPANTTRHMDTDVLHHCSAFGGCRDSPEQKRIVADFRQFSAYRSEFRCMQRDKVCIFSRAHPLGETYTEPTMNVLFHVLRILWMPEGYFDAHTRVRHMNMHPHVRTQTQAHAHSHTWLRNAWNMSTHPPRYVETDIRNNSHPRDTNTRQEGLVT